MELIEVINEQHQKQFIDLPLKIYKDDAEWIQPMDADIENIFNREVNPQFQNGGECIRFLLLDQGTPIGRAAAFYTLNPDKKKLGGMGFFECINDKNAAFLLFDACADWLRKQGAEWMDGPINFGDRDSFWGLMVKGFKNPSYRENYNPSYYQELFESYGFVKEIEQNTREITRASFKDERFGKIAARILSNPKYTFSHFDWKNKEKLINDFIIIYNQAWAHHENFTPMTYKKMLGHLKLMKPIMKPEFTIFAYADGEPAGVYISVLDVNQVFKYLHGKLTFWGKLKFLYYRPKINRVRGIVFGVIPKYQNLGLETGMIMKFREEVIKYKKIHANELAWVGDFNPKMLSMLDAMGAVLTKVHYTYRKIL